MKTGVKTYFLSYGQKKILPKFELCCRKVLGLCTLFFNNSKFNLMYMLYCAVIEIVGTL